MDHFSKMVKCRPTQGNKDFWVETGRWDYVNSLRVKRSRQIPIKQDNKTREEAVTDVQKGHANSQDSEDRQDTSVQLSSKPRAVSSVGDFHSWTPYVPALVPSAPVFTYWYKLPRPISLDLPSMCPSNVIVPLVIYSNIYFILNHFL